MVPTTPCVVWTGSADEQGYGHRRFDGKRQRVHRIAVAEVDGWDAIEGKVVMHLCDNPPCYRYDHLRIGTPADNNGDARLKGRTARGAKQWKSKLTDADVVEILAAVERGETHKAIAVRFGIDRTNVGHIVNRKTWRHVAA